ncbi:MULTISPECIES: hypothetical protein [unclassified Bradyrhizobium]|uniref:hypothetical protein n=2 Tax=unclassified Bradyrhizobium TaxID=2631580 RepID=UPI0028E4DA39|nr:MULTISPECIES: hypothetical protein [unclassified Bradyrhizobium]
MDWLLWVPLGLTVMLAWCSWSIGRSYYERGRIQGMREAAQQIRLGMTSQLDQGAIPSDLAKAEVALKIVLDDAARRQDLPPDTIHARLWALGAALGDACWVKGHAAGVRRKAPAEGRIRLDLSLVEMLQLGGLANFGFQHMMPNVRLIDARRFADKNDAIEASRSLSRLEAALPRDYRPDLLSHARMREDLINDWWRSRAIA